MNKQTGTSVNCETIQQQERMSCRFAQWHGWILNVLCKWNKPDSKGYRFCSYNILERVKLWSQKTDQGYHWMRKRRVADHIGDAKGNL